MLRGEVNLMGYRRKVDHRLQATQKVWLNANWPTLDEIGLPPEVFRDYDHWDDFLENGDLDWHKGSDFDFTQLTMGQMRQLRDLLEKHCGEAPRTPPLLQFLRVRCAENYTSKHNS